MSLESVPSSLLFSSYLSDSVRILPTIRGYRGFSIFSSETNGLAVLESMIHGESLNPGNQCAWNHRESGGRMVFSQGETSINQYLDPFPHSQILSSLLSTRVTPSRARSLGDAQVSSLQSLDLPQGSVRVSSIPKLAPLLIKYNAALQWIILHSCMFLLHSLFRGTSEGI